MRTRPTLFSGVSNTTCRPGIPSSVIGVSERSVPFIAFSKAFWAARSTVLDAREFTWPGA